MAKRVWLVVLAVVLLVGTMAATLAAQVPTQQDGFVPVDPSELQEALPAAPLVFAAYGFVWLVFVIYLFTLWRRIGNVEAELRHVTARLEGDRG